MEHTRAVACLSCWLLAVGCGSEASPTLAPEPKQEQSSDIKADNLTRKQTVPAPDTAAFIPKLERCPVPYEDRGGTCVHAYYLEKASKAELESQLALYARGAAPPRADGSVATTARNAPTGPVDPAQLDPSALTEPPQKKDESVAQERVKALDDVLASVRKSVAAAQIERLATPPGAAGAAGTGAAAVTGTGPGATGGPRATPNTNAPARATRESADLALVETDQATIAGAPDDVREPGASPTEANIAGPPERELGLGDAREGETSRAGLEERLAQVREIQTLLRDIPVTQRSELLRKLEQSGARAAVGDDTWNELVTRRDPE